MNKLTETPKIMNIYEKLSKARVDLQNLKLKKSGKNEYSHFEYYELSDFLPAINSLANKYEFTTRFDIVVDKGIEKAVLTLYDWADDNKKIVFTTPTAEVEIGKKKDGTGGAEPIQNLGGKITYMRRYLMQIAFEIIDTEMVDSINRDLTDEIDKEDIKTIEDCKTEVRLNELYSIMSKKYKMTLIQPIFSKVKTQIQQNESKA